MAELAFSKWRARLWPIHRQELQKIIPLLLMKFLISLNYALLTSMKDAMVVTARGGGAEVIPVLKGWGVLPVAIFAAFLYAKLSTRLRPTTMFALILFSFLSLIGLYGYVLYPNVEALSPHHSADLLQAWLGAGRGQHWVAVYRNWIPSLFFIMAELWGSFAIFILFWGFTSQIHTLSEAKRTYTLYIAAGDLASILAGRMLVHYSQANTEFLTSLQSITFFILLFGCGIFCLYQWLVQRVLPKGWDVAPRVATGTSDKNPSFRKSIAHLFSSRYVLSLAVMVIAVALTVNMIEVSWKASLKLLYPETVQYQAYMGNITSIIGTVAFITVLLIGGGLIRYLGWFISALLTPIVVGISGVLFLGLILFYRTQSTWLFGMQIPLTFIVLVGAIQQVAAKVMKYSFFDSTKEMAFIPLSPEEKTQGKAAVDVVSSRLGKSGSSWLQVGLLDLFGHSSVLAISHFLLPVIVLAVVAWVYAIRTLRPAVAASEENA